MLKNNKKNIGDYYEKLAEKYLIDHNYTIIAKNYRYKTIDIYKPLEIDIIAFKNGVVYGWEVKYRSNCPQFFPISHKKIQNIKDCFENFLYHNPQWQGYYIQLGGIIIDNHKLNIINLIY